MQVFKYLSEKFIPPHILLFLLVIPPLSIGMTPPGPLQSYTCVRVVDGDTAILKKGQTLVTVRLSSIDAPESSQKSVDGVEIGQISTQKLISLIEGKIVQLKIEGIDMYKRSIGEIFLDGKSINLNMVRSGYAISYPKKASFIYRQAQFMAKRKRLGIWQGQGFTAPKVYRKAKKRQTGSI